MDFKKYQEMYEKAKSLHDVWVPRKDDYYFEKDDPNYIRHKISRVDIAEMKKNKDKYIWLTSTTRDLKRPELINHQIRVSTYNQVDLIYANYENAKVKGKINFVKNDIIINYLQAIMYIFFEKEWDEENKEWIKVNKDIWADIVNGK